jgi:hypothetical protein
MHVIDVLCSRQTPEDAQHTSVDIDVRILSMKQFKIFCAYCFQTTELSCYKTENVNLS